MIPIYSIISFVSYWDFYHAIYWETLRDCYEAFAIASFFTLLCNYIEPTLHEQKEYFRKLTPRNWVLPISWFQRCTGGPEKGPFRKPRSGLTFFNACAPLLILGIPCEAEPKLTNVSCFRLSGLESSNTASFESFLPLSP